MVSEVFSMEVDADLINQEFLDVKRETGTYVSDVLRVWFLQF